MCPSSSSASSLIAVEKDARDAEQDAATDARERSVTADSAQSWYYSDICCTRPELQSDFAAALNATQNK